MLIQTSRHSSGVEKIIHGNAKVILQALHIVVCTNFNITTFHAEYQHIYCCDNTAHNLKKKLWYGRTQLLNIHVQPV